MKILKKILLTILFNEITVFFFVFGFLVLVTVIIPNYEIKKQKERKNETKVRYNNGR